MAISRVTASFRQYMRRYRFKSFPVVSEIPSVRRFFSADALASFQSVGFIGLGNMGTRMANNLIKAGYKMVVHDINRNTMKKYSDLGVATKETPFEVAEASDVVITMLPSPSHVLDVYNGSYGLLHGGRHLRPWLLIDSSTIDPQTSRELSAIVSSRILKEKRDSWESPVMLDAPVSGGILAADAGTLTFMVGGPEEAYFAAKALFLSMGKGSVYCGGAGNGSAAKICNNLALAVSMLGVSEALALGQSLGISAKTLTKVFNSSSARCWSSESYNPVPGVMEEVPSARDYDGGFASKLMQQQLVELASNIHSPPRRKRYTKSSARMDMKTKTSPVFFVIFTRETTSYNPIPCQVQVAPKAALSTIIYYS